MRARSTIPEGYGADVTVNGGPRRHASIVLGRLGHLLSLQLELGLAEVRELTRTIAVALVVGLASVILFLASLITLVAGALAPLFDAEPAHLLVAGGAFALLALAGIVWAIVRVRGMTWPTLALHSIEETGQWLGTQLRSGLTLR